MFHAVEICGIHFSQYLLELWGYGDNGGYSDFGGIVRSGEQVPGDGAASISFVGILFVVFRGKDRAVIHFEEWSGCHPRLCDTEASFGHIDV